MKKKLLAKLFGLPVIVWILLLIGTVSAVFVVTSLYWEGEVKEPIQVTLIQDLPSELYPASTYEYILDVENVGDGELEVDINMMYSSQLEVEVDLGSFTLPASETVRVTCTVFVPPDAEPSGAWLDVEVTRG